jgi:hypothetical protein
LEATFDGSEDDPDVPGRDMPKNAVVPLIRTGADAADELPAKAMVLISSGTGIERKPHAERLLPRRPFRPFQIFGDTRSRGLPFRHRLQLTDFV